MAERTKLWVYFAFGVVFVLIYSVVSHWVWHPDGWLFALGMQDFAGSTVVHYQGALAALAGALLLGPRLGKYGADGKVHPIPGHSIPLAIFGVLVLFFGLLVTGAAYAALSPAHARWWTGAEALPSLSR